MGLDIEQLLDIKELQATFDALYDAAGIPSALVDLNGRILTQSGWQDICLNFHRKNPGTKKLCGESDLALKKMLESGETSPFYQCAMGLVDSCCPVIVDGQPVAFVFTGQFFHRPLTDEDLTRFRHQARKYGFAEEEYLDSVQKVPVIPPEKHKKILSFLRHLTGQLMIMASQSVAIGQNKERFEKTFTAINEGIWEWDLQKGEIEFNSRCHEILGYPAKSFGPDAGTLKMMIHPGDREMVDKSFSEAIRKDTMFNQDFRMLKADLSYVWVQGRGRVVEKNDQGKPILMLGTLTDISEKQHFRKSFETAFDYSPAMMSISDLAAGRFVNVNKVFLDVTGYARDAVIGAISTDLGLISLEDRKNLVEIVSQEGRVENYRLKLKKADGEEFFCDYSGAVINMDGDEYLLSLIVDISGSIAAEQEKMQFTKQLRQAQKLEAIGTLAGGIAHDFNNILSAMLGYTDMAIEDLEQGSRTWQDLQNVMIAGGRAKELVGQILTFSRQKETSKAVVQPASLVKEAVKLLRSTLPATIKIEREVMDQQSTVYADPVQLHQVIMNICTNAFHAMQESGGVLKIVLMDAKLLPASIVRDAARKNEGYLQISISDTGTGIDPSIMDRIFDPFFTSKEEGEGTGMGLSIAYGIVKGLGGAITVESIRGQGSTFHLFLPKTGEGELQLMEPEIQITGGDETILFVDDEEILVTMNKENLEKLGYTVIGMTSSTEALRRFEEAPEGFDLIITDYTMPDLTGFDLAKRILSLRPSTPVIICTGYSERVDEKVARHHGVRGFLYKPILKSKMANAIREVIDAAA